MMQTNTPAQPAQKLHITQLADWLAARYRAAGGKAGITDVSAWAEEVMRWTEAQHGIGADLEPDAGASAKPLLLKGIGKISGDGWKNTTTRGQVVYVWNRPKPEPYAPGQYPRLGNPIYSASTDQFDFEPLAEDEAIAVIEEAIEKLRTEMLSLKDKVVHAGGNRMNSWVRR
jgi:hypothetical protein